ncbi:MAG: ATP-binding protein [Bacteroidota bacterium]
MESVPVKERLNIIVLILLLSTCFLADILSPKGITVWISYVFVLLYSSSKITNIDLRIIAGIITILIALGYRLAPQGVKPEIIVEIARILGIISMWILTILLTNDRKNRKTILLNEKKFRSLYENILEGILYLDGNGRIIDANRNAEEMLNIPLSHMMDKKLNELGKEIIHTNGLVFSDTEYPSERVTNTGAAVNNIVMGICCGDGDAGKKIRWINMNAVPLYKNGSLQPDQIVVSFDDVTKLVETERKLEEERNQARLYFDIAGVLMIVLDTTGIIKRINKKGIDILNYKHEELSGRNWFELCIPNRNREELLDSFKSIASDRAEPWSNFEMPVLTKDNTLRTLRVNSSVVYDYNDDISEIVISGEDITETNEAMRQIRESNRDLEQFAYIVSHDLQEPVRMMRNYSQILQRRYKGRLDSDANDFLFFIEDSALRMQQLIRDLLHYSRLNTRGKPFSNVDCNEVMADVIDDLYLTIQEENVRIAFSELPCVYGDKTQIRQLFQNLIQNSIRFRSTKDPEIEITYWKDASYYYFSFRDNGIGINPEYHKLIFEMFKRLHDRGEYPGTGIGLAICKKIIDRHGGEIYVISKEGEGCDFRFSLPEGGI